MVKSTHTITMTLAELGPLIIRKANAAIAEQKLDQPNALVKEQKFLDQHWRNPVVVFEGEPKVQLESHEGDLPVFLLMQPIHLEAEKTEAQGRTRMWPLSEATNQVTVDPHDQLFSGSLHIHARMEIPKQPTKLKDLTMVLHIIAAPSGLKSETEVGGIVPIPGVRDLIQKGYEAILSKAEEEKREYKTVELNTVSDKVKELNQALQEAKLANVRLVTRRQPDGILLSFDLEGDLNLLDKD